MAKPILTLERLKELLSYDPKDGSFTRIANYNTRARIGQKAGTHDGHGYLVTQIDGRSYFLHRLAWFYMTGEWPKETIDHIDGDGSDNRFANLRDVSPAAQQQNRRPNRNNQARLLGVYAPKRATTARYVARITVNHRDHNLGCFSTPEEAHAAYIAAKRKLHEFGVL